MKYPIEHYPNSGIQHTRCVVALTMATLCLELYQGKPITEFAAIQASIRHCTADTKKKQLSGGAKRDIDNCSIVVADYIDILRSKSGEEILRAWGALVWCALTFIEDAVYTCPYYTDGVKGKRWDKMRTRMEALAEALLIEIPGVDEAGTYLYEKAAWALEGKVFQDKDREALLA